MATMQERAQKRITKWKKQLKKGWWIEQATGLDQTTISRIFHGRGVIDPAKCKQVVNAQEPTE